MMMGVIIGFAILLFSERDSGSDLRMRLAAARRNKAPKLEADPEHIARLNAEIARLEALLAQKHEPVMAVAENPKNKTNQNALPPSAVALPAPTRPTPVTTEPRRPEPPRDRAGTQEIRARVEADLLPAPPGYAEHAVLEGTVTEAATGNPVKSFIIGMRKNGGDWVSKEVNDRYGRFKWTADPGKADVYVQTKGFREWTTTDVELLAGTISRIAVEVSKERRLEGHVLDAETGLPVACAVITLPPGTGGDPDWKAITDSRGWFSVRSPFKDGAPQRVKISHDDYASLITDAPAIGRAAFRLPRGSAVLIGAVKTLEGGPVYGATIRVVKDDPIRPEVKSVTTDVEGRFRVGGLTPGRFLVWASARQFPGAVRVIDLGLGETALTEFVFRKGLSLAGRLIRTAGHEGQTLIIQAYDASGGYLMETPVSRDNAFLLENLEPGEYSLKVVDKGSARMLKSFVIRVPIANGEITLSL
jgi:hypothetical protein